MSKDELAERNKNSKYYYIMAIWGLLACCCSLSSSVVGGFVGGFIPKTGPHLLKVSGAGKVFSKENMDFYDVNLSDPTRLTPGFKLYEKEKDKVDKFCSDVKSWGEWQKNLLDGDTYHGPGDVFTLAGSKPTKEALFEGFGERDRGHLDDHVFAYCAANAQSFRKLTTVGEGTAS